MITKAQIISSLKMWYGENWEISIYQFYSGQTIYPDKNILSPLRDDDNSPSLRVFKTENNEYLCYDYGRNKTYNVFTFVQAYHDNKNKIESEFNINTICNYIDKDMNLGIENTFDICIPNLDFELAEREYKKTESPLIAVYPDKFSIVDARYWGRFYITKEWLDFFDIGVCYKVLFSYNKGITWKDNYFRSKKNPCYYYHFIDSNNESKFKLLQPYSENKWRTNINKYDLHSIQGFRQADLTQEKVFLTSSLKDVIILRMLGYTAYALHGEAYIPTLEFIEHLKKYHKEVYLFLDNDNAGVEASNKILSLDKIFKKAIYIPDGMYFENNKKVKDPSDYIEWSNGDFITLHNIIKNEIN